MDYTTVVMGVDQSLTGTGIVIKRGKYVIHYEVFRTKKTFDDIYQDTLFRANLIAERIVVLRNQFAVKVISMEGLSLGSIGNATRTLAMLLGYIQGRLRIVPYIVPIGTLKKFATGNGNADKDAMFNRLAEANPDFFTYVRYMTKAKGKYDLADAYWLASHAQTEIRIDEITIASDPE